MNNLMNIARKAMAIVAFLTLSVAADAAEVVYRIVEYNKQTAEFEIAACGMVPRNSRVYFENEFGATTGNRYNQIPRNGAAAADFDGMDESHYLDAVAVPSTADVTSPDVLRFTLGKTDAQNWTFTDQYGRKLGATGKQQLAWNEGATEWTVDLGYDGATIAPAGAEYGTLRYSTPDNNYARFNLYTSKSLPLPFLYIKGEQKQPEQSRSLAFAEEEQTVSLDAAHIGLRPTLLPKTTTDKRLRWTSSDESVATVAGGFVTLLGVGETTITAAAYDGGAEATIRLIVTEPTAINGVTSGAKMQRPRKVLSGNKVVIQTEQGRYGVDAAMW